MRSDLFMHEVTGTSNVFGRKSGVKVVFKGDRAATNHDTIYLPSLGADKSVSDEQQRIVRGYADHEAGHIRHTDRKASEALFEEVVRDKNMLLKHVWNALEDVWLERRVISEYPGSLENLKATASAVDREAMEQMAEAGAKVRDPKVIGPVAITWEGRKPYGHGTGEQCLERVDPKLRSRLGDWVKALDGCHSTSDVIELARKVTDELRSDEFAPLLPPPLPPQQSDKPSDDKDEDESNETFKLDSEEGSTPTRSEGEQTDAEPADDETENETETETEASEESDDDAADDAEPDDEKPEAAAGDSAGASGGGSKDGEPTPKDEYEDGEIIDFAIERALQKEIKELIETDRNTYRPYTTEHDKWHTRNGNHPHSKILYGRGSALRYQGLIDNMAGSVNVARRTLERVLAAKMNREWDYGREAGRLDSRRLVRAYNAQPNVFKVRSETGAIDTAVLMLIDLSGSMVIGGKDDVARDTAIIFTEAMVKAGVAVEVLGFNNATGPDADASVGQYSRYEPLDMYVFKAFDERLIDARSAMSVIDQFTGGNNTDGEALLYAYDRLKKRPEKRRIMLVLSDGMPYAECFWGERHLEEHLRQVVKEISMRGVECVGIGICDDSVSKFYPRHSVIWNARNLGTTVMSEIGKVLLGDDFVLRGAA